MFCDGTKRRMGEFLPAVLFFFFGIFVVVRLAQGATTSMLYVFHEECRPNLKGSIVLLA